jgi:hypothetical protein
MDGDPLAWRYINNTKDSITEEYRPMHIVDVRHSALVYPKPRSSHPCEQGVISCHGVGNHLGYNVVKKKEKKSLTNEGM